MAPPRFAPYKSALEAVSARTRTPLPSLIASFAVLHELTAMVPLISVFFFARSLGFGEQAIAFVQTGASDREANRGWIREKGAQWIDEGERWAARVGKRYGVFGYSKVPKGSDTSGTSPQPLMHSHNLAGDVANAVFAYGVTKVRSSFPGEGETVYTVCASWIPEGASASEDRDINLSRSCIFETRPGAIQVAYCRQLEKQMMRVRSWCTLSLPECPYLHLSMVVDRNTC